MKEENRPLAQKKYLEDALDFQCNKTNPLHIQSTHSMNNPGKALSENSLLISRASSLASKGI